MAFFANSSGFCCALFLVFALGGAAPLGGLKTAIETTDADAVIASAIKRLDQVRSSSATLDELLTPVEEVLMLVNPALNLTSLTPFQVMESLVDASTALFYMILGSPQMSAPSRLIWITENIATDLGEVDSSNVMTQSVLELVVALLNVVTRAIASEDFSGTM